MLGEPDRLQQQMRGAEGEVERRVAVHRGLGVEEQAVIARDDDVLWANVAVDQRDVAVGEIVGERGQHVCGDRHAFGSVAQERCDAQRVEQRGIVTTRLTRGGGMNARQIGAEPTGERGIDAAGDEFVAPHRALAPAKDEQMIGR